ncbi:hypothetical protein F0U44_12940 [Nocardioides humilatus]|uniref:Uncharacterized protein n=1 Tax=Nocardioides humilatus TaxID=2607660 RepID=A0A5B1LF28_9ACTN|nr:hypothetical protein F0U44_12940 [Nocardioides humilatus]
MQLTGGDGRPRVEAVGDVAVVEGVQGLDRRTAVDQRLVASGGDRGGRPVGLGTRRRPHQRGPREQRQHRSQDRRATPPS